MAASRPDNDALRPRWARVLQHDTDGWQSLAGWLERRTIAEQQNMRQAIEHERYTAAQRHVGALDVLDGIRRIMDTVAADREEAQHADQPRGTIRHRVTG
jgi:hypothetical protein